MYTKVITQLQQAYDAAAANRDTTALDDWKLAERQYFLNLLHSEDKTTLLEIGAGPGHFGRYFQDNGLIVTCTDLSPAMVRLCQAKGLTAYVMDFLHLDFPDQSFAALFALNCLLHVPLADKPHVLAEIHRLLQPGGLFYLGIYGGEEFEGIWADDFHEPKRFFSYHTDEAIQNLVAPLFDLVYFRPIELAEGRPGFHFQSMIWRRREPDNKRENKSE
ncbi:MAG: class I SAM-dependent methyltransferase [Chloroflexi bacterium]|nr:class I SAM-dependent methyltransferase [Chloroflexota bacterium]MBP8059060.1 class I SAM-dependent methyltransferase [Chloroflexota bacterium]